MAERTLDGQGLLLRQPTQTSPTEVGQKADEAAAGVSRTRPPWVRVALLQRTSSPVEILVLRRRWEAGASTAGTGIPERVQIADLPGIGETQKVTKLIDLELRGLAA